MLMRKPCRINSTLKALVKALERTCSRDHEHAQSRGKALRDSELSTPLLCRNIIKYFLDGTVPTALVAEVLTAGRVKAFVTPTGEVQQKPVVDDSADDQESPALTEAVAQLHVNLGHPSNDALQSNSGTIGYSSGVIAEVEGVQ